MSRKKDMIPFSPLYEPLIRDRYRDKYVVGSAAQYARWRGSDSMQGMLAADYAAQFEALESAGMYFARSDMVSLAVAAMLDGDVPQVAPPSPSGFLLLEGGVRPLGHAGADAPMIYGFLWFVGVDGGLQYAMIPDVLFPPIGVRVPQVRMQGHVNVWRDMVAFKERDVHGVPQEEALLRTMFALWAEPRVCEVGEPRPERLARVSSRVVEAARHVRVVDVREHDEPEREASRDGVRKYRPYDHRFIVSGHWREQAYGPNHSERRRQWIAPFVKGPKDKPLVLKDTVRVWRG